MGGSREGSSLGFPVWCLNVWSSKDAFFEKHQKNTRTHTHKQQLNHFPDLRNDFSEEKEQLIQPTFCGLRSLPRKEGYGLWSLNHHNNSHLKPLKVI